MHAQGWEFPNGEVRQIDVPGKGTLPVMRLKSHKTERQPDGSGQLLENVCYYWFAGRDEVTASHMARARIDALVDRFEAAQSTEPPRGPEDERPPHY